jgi:alpha-ketoglutarate-dependent taurine dioxygenase
MQRPAIAPSVSAVSLSQLTPRSRMLLAGVPTQLVGLIRRFSRDVSDVNYRRENDLVLFHNRGVLHTVVGAFAPDQVRAFHQVRLLEIVV